MEPVVNQTMQTVLVLVNAGIGLFMLMMSFTLRRLVKDLDDNTVATNTLASSVGELHTSIAKYYVSKSDFDALDSRLRQDLRELTTKYDTLNREVGSLSSQVEHGVKKLKYD